MKMGFSCSLLFKRTKKKKRTKQKKTLVLVVQFHKLTIRNIKIFFEINIQPNATNMFKVMYSRQIIKKKTNFNGFECNAFNIFVRRKQYKKINK